MSGDVFVFYEYVAAASDTEDDMARALIEDLAGICAHSKIREAASLVRQSAAQENRGLTPGQELAWVLARQDAEKKVKKQSGIVRFDDFGRRIS